VAMTRAKANLTVHLNGGYLNHIRVDDFVRNEDRNQYAEPEEIALQLGYKDVWLGYFTERQEIIMGLKSGDRLLYRDGHWLNDKGISVFRPSQACAGRLEQLQQRGYVPAFAKVNFVVWWKGEDQEQEIRIVLPEVHLQRQH